MLFLRGYFKNRRFFPSETIVVMMALASFVALPGAAHANSAQCEITFSGDSSAATAGAPARSSPETKKEETIADLLKKGAPGNVAERLAIEEKLEVIQHKLKTDFVGWDGVVDQLMNASKLLLFYGDEVVTKPIVVPILGFPGYGKTTLIQRWQEMMGFGDIALQENVEKNQTYIPYEKIIGAGRPAHEDPNITKQRPLIDFVLTVDEVQNLMDAKQVDELIKASAEAPKVEDPTGDIMRSLNEKRDLATKINKSRQFWWEILGNGSYQVRLTDPSNQLDLLQSHTGSYNDAVASKKKSEAKIRKLEADLTEDHADDIETIRSQIKGYDRNANSYRT